MMPKNALFLLLFLPLLTFSQKTNKTWKDVMLNSHFDIRFDREKQQYLFTAEKYGREGEYGTLAKGSADRIRQVVAEMDAAFQSKDPDKLFALGRFKYTFQESSLNDLIDVELLKVEDLIKDDSGELPVYMMSAGTLAGIVEFAKGLE